MPDLLTSVMSGRKIDSGNKLFSLRNVKGCSIRLQYSKNPNTMQAIIPEEPTGRARYAKSCHSLAPSSFADSIRLSGISEKKRYMINTGNVEKTPGNITPHKLSVSLKKSNTR